MGKRGSGAPRHPRSPVAKAVRTPAFKMQVVPDKRWKNTLKEAEFIDPALKDAALNQTEGAIKADDADKSED
jgi:hypothetical protein